MLRTLTTESPVDIHGVLRTSVLHEGRRQNWLANAQDTLVLAIVQHSIAAKHSMLVAAHEHLPLHRKTGRVQACGLLPLRCVCWHAKWQLSDWSEWREQDGCRKLFVSIVAFDQRHPLIER